MGFLFKGSFKGSIRRATFRVSGVGAFIIRIGFLGVKYTRVILRNPPQKKQQIALVII